MKSLNTAELSDALDAHGIEGALLSIKPLANGTRLYGPAYTVRYLPYKEKPQNFSPAGDYIDNVPAGSVIVIDNQGIDDCTVWGGILTQVAMTKHIAGTVVHGAVRDVALIRALNYPVFSQSIYMRSGKNRVYKAQEQCSISIGGIVINPGDMIVADDNGVLAIPASLVDDIAYKAQTVKRVEDDIIKSVQAGLSLAEARKKHGYDKPWVRSPEHA
jgi:regulator of RNase E activity RraA